MNRVRGSAGQGQHATLLKHCFRLAEQRALFVRQSDKFVRERVCRDVVPAEDMGIVRDGQRQHQSGGLADLARFFDRVVNIRLRGLGIAKQPEGPTHRKDKAVTRESRPNRVASGRCSAGS